MRRELTRERLDALMAELANSAPGRALFRVYLVGGATAVHAGWRPSTIDADLHADDERVFHDVQAIKERLDLNVEFARPEHFVPPLGGTESRHIFIRTIGRVSFFLYDPYAQLLSKVVRGFERDVQDGRNFIASGMVEPERFRSLVQAIPDEAFSRYPTLTKDAIRRAVEEFLGPVPSPRSR